MAAAVARRSGARRIMLTDVNDWRLEFAAKIAPDIRTVNVAKENPKDVMVSMGSNEGFDVGFEMSGQQSAFDGMLDLMIMGGNIAVLGLPSKPYPFDMGKFVGKALTMKGIYGRQMYETWYKMIALLDSGLDMTPMITHRFPAKDFQKAFDLMETGKSGKVILDWADV
jgi:threonine 3-dehydrogenase